MTLSLPKQLTGTHRNTPRSGVRKGPKKPRRACPSSPTPLAEFMQARLCAIAREGRTAGRCPRDPGNGAFSGEKSDGPMDPLYTSTHRLRDHRPAPDSDMVSDMVGFWRL